MSKFAEKLTELMEEKAVSQSELAKYLNIGQQTVSKYVNKKIEPGLDAVVKIAKFFGVTVGFLLGAEE